MKRSIRQKLIRHQRRAEARIRRGRERRVSARGYSLPVISTQARTYELSDRSRGICHGGAPLLLRLAERVGLVEAINRQVPLLKRYLPYRESDHVLNFALNAWCDGVRLEDMELRRNDEAFLAAVGAETLPDPTTEGDFCRRFRDAASIYRLQDAFDTARLNVWRQQPEEFFGEAIIEMDGTMVVTTGSCKRGMDISYKKTWGYHPLVVTLAHTKEVLSIVNRPGNRPSHEGSPAEADRAIALCRKAGFRKIRLRADGDFSLTQNFDRWDAAGVTFEFGFDANQTMVLQAESLENKAWKKLSRPPRYQIKTEPRRRPQDVKRKIIRQRDYLHLELKSEQVAEFDYRPIACQKTYRVVVVRKNISNEIGDAVLFDEIRYFFYITNDREKSAEEVVFSCNDRCDQENLLAQLAGGVRSLSAPVDNLYSNWAYMVMTSLAWTLKSWAALLLPVSPRHEEQHTEARASLLKMEFRTFLNVFVRLPCQVVQQARRVVLRILTYSPYLPSFFRLCDVLRC